ncbi:MAG: hypothetical protein ACFFCT_00765 [Candidatus Odinarchaeota archaeon]
MLQKDKTCLAHYMLARDLKFHFGPWAIRISGTRAITLSILLVSYLLVTTNQFAIDPQFRPQGDMDIQFTTPIDQNMTYSIETISTTSLNSYVVLNTSQISSRGHFPYFQLPRFEYDRMVFNVSLEPRNNPVLATFSVYCDGHGSSTAGTILKLSTLSLELNMAEIKEESNRWLIDISSEVRPAADFFVHSLVVWVYSTVPLTPVSIDLQATDGQNLFETPMFGNMGSSPYLYAFLNNNTSNIDSLYLKTANHTLYLRPGSLNGTAKYFHISEGRASVPFDIAYSSNEKLTIHIRLVAIRLDLDIDAEYPLTHIYIDGGGIGNPYDLYIPPDLIPDYLYIAPIYTAYITISLSELYRSEGYWLDPIVLSSGNVNINGSYNLRVSTNFSPLTLGGIAIVSDIVLGFLSLILLALIIIRLLLSLNIPMRSIRKDFRLIPLVAFLIFSFIPWFNSQRVLAPSNQDFEVPVHSLSLGPIPLIGFWTDGSAIAWRIPPEAIVWSIVAIALYWLPVIGTALRFSTPSNRENDVKMGIILLLPTLFIGYVNIGLYGITGGYASISLPLAVGLAIPSLWFLSIGILTVLRKYKRDDISSKLERDLITIQEMREVPAKSDERSLSKELSDDFATWRGLFALFLVVILPIFPCAVTDSSQLFLPYFGYYRIGTIWDYSHWGLATLIIGIPYCIFSLVTIVALWMFVKREISIVWVVIGAILSVLSSLPGAFLLGFTILPIAVIVFTALSFIVWLKQAYEDAEESTNDDEKATNPKLEKKT